MSESNRIITRDDISLIRSRIRSAFSQGFTIKNILLFAIALLCATLFIFPMYWLLKISLTSANLYSGIPSLSLTNPTPFNFVDVLYRIPYIQYLLNSVVITGIAVVSNLVLNTFIAYALTKKFKGRRLIRTLLVVGMLIPFQTSIIPAFLVTKNLGLLNTRLGVALPYAASIICILILADSFRQVPDSLLESARLDGASELYVIFGVLWPLSKPALVTNVILSFVFAWNAFLWPLIIISESNVQPLPLALSNFQSSLSGAFALQYAFVILAILPVIVMFLLLQNQFIRSVAASAIKG